MLFFMTHLPSLGYCFSSEWYFDMIGGIGEGDKGGGVGRREKATIRPGPRFTITSTRQGKNTSFTWTTNLAWLLI